MPSEAARILATQVKFEIDQGSVDSTIGGIDRLSAAYQKIVADAAAFTAADQSLSQGFDDLQPVIDQEISQINTLADSFRANAAAEQEWSVVTEEQNAKLQQQTQLTLEAEAAYSNYLARNVGYGAEGGAIGPAEAEDGGGGGRSGLGGYGMSRGFGAAAALARQSGAEGLGGGLQVTGEILRVQNALGRFGTIFSNLNTTVEATPGLLGPVVSGFSALGVPMAGLAAVAVPVVAGVVAVGAALATLKAHLDEGKDAVDAAIKGQEAGFGALKKTSDELSLEIAQKQDDQTRQLEKEKQTRAAILEGLNEAVAKGPIAAVEYGLAGATKDLEKQAEDAKTKAAEFGNEITNLQGALGNTTVAATDASEAARKHAEAITAAGQRYAQYDQMSTKQVDDQITVLNGEVESRKQSIAVLQANNAAQGTSNEQIALNNQAIDKYNDEINQATGDILHLTNVSHDLAVAHDEQKAAADRLKESLKELSKAQEDLNTNMAKQAEETDAYQRDIVDAQKQAYEDNEAAIQGHSDQVDKLQLDAFRKEEDAVQASGDKIADIRAKSGDKEAAAFTNYLDQLDDDQTKYQDNRGKLLRDFDNNQAEDALKGAQKSHDMVAAEQNSEERDKLAHEQRLADIRRSAQDDEWNAVLDGNFEQLYIDQEHETQKETDENVRYDNQEANLRLQLRQQEDLEIQHNNDSLALQKLHLQQQEQEQDIALRELETSQITSYDRKLRDLKIAENNEIDAANTAEERKLRDLNTWEIRQQSDLDAAEERKLQLITQNLGREFVVLQNNYDLRLQLLQQEEHVLEMQINRLQVPRDSVSDATQFAEGGSFGAGQGFEMSEAGYSETLKIAGRSYKVGGGAAYVYPLQGGSVDAGDKGRGSIGSVAVYLQNPPNDPVATARMVAETLDEYTRSD